MALPTSPASTGADLTTDATYPENLTNSGYGGSASLPTGPADDDEEYDEEELTITDDDDDEVDVTEEDQDDDI